MPKQKQFKLTYFILQLKWARNAHPLSYRDSVNQEYLYKLQQFDHLQLFLYLKRAELILNQTIPVSSHLRIYPWKPVSPGFKFSQWTSHPC